MSQRSPIIPTCPLHFIRDHPDDSCFVAGAEGHILDLEEVKLVFDRGVHEKYHEAAEAECLKTIAENLFKVQRFRKQGFVRCPRCPGEEHEGYWVELPEEVPECKVTCQNCDYEFCGICMR